MLFLLLEVWYHVIVHKLNTNARNLIGKTYISHLSWCKISVLVMHAQSKQSMKWFKKQSDEWSIHFSDKLDRTCAMSFYPWTLPHIFLNVTRSLPKLSNLCYSPTYKRSSWCNLKYFNFLLNLKLGWSLTWDLLTVICSSDLSKV